MSCQTSANRARLAAVRSGIAGTANKALYLVAENKNMLAVGVSVGALTAVVKNTADKANYEQQAIRSAAYKTTLSGIANFAAQGAAAGNPETRQAILKLARNRLDNLGEIGYRGLQTGLRQKLQQQHQLVANWMDQAGAAERETGSTRAFVLGAAQAGEFGMKQFGIPTLSPPSTQTAITTGILVGAAAATSYAALAIARRRQSVKTDGTGSRKQSTNSRSEAAIKMEPVRDSSLTSAMGYDNQQRTLAMTFKSNGQTYIYKDVPPAVAGQLLDTKQKGQVFHHHIRGKYETIRLAEKPDRNGTKNRAEN